MKTTWTIVVCLVVIWAHGLEAREISRDNQKSHGSNSVSVKISTTSLKSTTEPTPVRHVSSTGNPKPISTTPQRRRWFNLHRTLRSQRNTRVADSNTTPNPKPTPSSTQKSQTSSLDKLAAIFGGHRSRTRNPQWNQRRVSTTTTESPSRSRSRSTRRTHTHTRRRTTTSTTSPITAGTSGPTGNQWVTLRTKRVHVKRIEKTAMAMDKDMLVQEVLHLIDLLPTVQPAVKHAPHDRSGRPTGDVKSNIVDSGGASVTDDGSDAGSKSGDGDSDSRHSDRKINDGSDSTSSDNGSITSSSSSNVDGSNVDSKRNHGDRSDSGSRNDGDDDSNSNSRDRDHDSDDGSSRSSDSSDDDDDDDKEAPQPKTVYVTILYRLRTGHTQINSDLLHALTTGQLMELIKRIQQEISKHQNTETTRRPRVQHRSGMELDKVCCPL